MGYLELLLIAIGLSMDAFAVAVTIGITSKDAAATKSVMIKRGLIAGLYFGFFQGLMPLIGYLLGTQFAEKISAFDHWVAVVLLAFIGTQMVIGSFKKDDDEPKEVSMKLKKMLPLAIATSIDALAVGVSFAMVGTKIVPAVLTIGVTTFALSFAGVLIGKAFGGKFKSKAELLGGVILILIGLKILIEHLFFQ